MTRARGESPALVQEFIELVHTIDRSPSGAEAAYFSILNFPRDKKEEFLFRADNQYDEEKRRFVEYNNEFVERKLAGHPPARILLLIPFCLQDRQCPHQVAWNIANCRHCGRCDVAAIRDVCERYGIALRVTIRSRFAPEFVREESPDLVMAVACEHEMVAGIMRVAPIFCYGIMNQRPEGYCKNTKVMVDQIESAAKKFTVTVQP
jgi:uncharacterized protein